MRRTLRRFASLPGSVSILGARSFIAPARGPRTLSVVALVVLLAQAPILAQQPSTIRASVDSSGAEANNSSGSSRLSGDGRLVVFSSPATNLVSGDTNARSDVFVRDLVSGVTTRVSVDSSGAQANDHCVLPAISADGRFVAFESYATLVPGDSNGFTDVFVHDLQTGATSVVSLSSAGAQGNDHSREASISSDGRFVAFQSDATNLVAGDTNQDDDVFLRDRQSGVTQRVSVDSLGVQANSGSYWCSISADGRWVAFTSDANNLVPGDTNNWGDVFVHDTWTHATSRVSVASSGAQATRGSYAPSLSGDGRFVAFWSRATNLVPGDTNGVHDVFVRDLQLGITTRVSVSASGVQGNGDSEDPVLSASGRYVGFLSRSSTFVTGDQNGWIDVFVHDRETGVMSRASVNTAGGQSNQDSSAASISGDGRRLSFSCAAFNLVAGDTNGDSDVFVRDRGAGILTRYCTAKTNSQACTSYVQTSGFPSASSASPFVIGASRVLSSRNGMLAYSRGAQEVPFQGGLLCISQPFERTPIQDSAGNVLFPCDGSFAFDMNARIQSGVDPALVAGAEVFAQYWSRDPDDPFTTHLTDAVAFVIEP